MLKLPSEQKARLIVNAPDSTTEIFVVDSRFQRVSSGLGNLETDLEAGLYKVRFRSGSVQRDELVEVTVNESPVYVTTEPLGFASAAPITYTRTTRMAHNIPAEVESQNVHLQRGHGSQLYLFVRDLQELPEEPPWTGVSLHDIAGNHIAHLSDGVCGPENNFAALNLELEPGTYRLRVDYGPLGYFEMFLITVYNWQTQVFLSTDDFQAGEIRVRRPVLKNAALFMVRTGLGFHPDGEHVRLAELARQGLASGRKVVSGANLNQLLCDKFENPMLGIYGAHLLLQSHHPNHELIDIVIDNLRCLVGSHTDVEALALHSKHRQRPDSFHFTSPPMLRSSWDLIVKDSRLRHATVPERSFAAQLADGLLSTTPWLLHRVPAVQRAEMPEYELNYSQTLRIIERLSKLGNHQVGRKLLEQVNLDRVTFTPLQHQIVASALDAGELSYYSGDSAQSMNKGQIVTAPQIVRNLDAPPASIASTTLDLIDKLGLSDLKK